MSHLSVLEHEKISNSDDQGVDFFFVGVMFQYFAPPDVR